MSSIVMYSGCNITPAPFVSFTDNPSIAGNQRRLGNTYQITVNGKLVSYKGSPLANAGTGGSYGGWNNQFYTGTGYPPDETGSLNHYLFALESKQKAMRSLFSVEGSFLEWTSPDGSTPMKCQPKNIVLNFQEGQWIYTTDYTITAETDVLYMNGQIIQSLPFPDYIQTASESWNIQPNPDAIKTFAVSHDVSAVGKKVFDSAGNEIQPAWVGAKAFVNQRLVLGFNGLSTFSPTGGVYVFQTSSLASGVINFNQYNPYNFSRSEVVDELAGSYQVNESWTLANASGTDIYQVSTQRISQDPYTTVVSNIQGTIRGFYVDLFDYDKRLEAAQYLFSQIGPTGLLARVTSAVGATGYTFNAQPRSAAIDYNSQDGSLTYNYEFCNTLYQGDAYEQYTVSRKSTADDYKSTYSIQGTVKGRRYDGDVDPLSGFNRASAYWDVISSPASSTFYNRVLFSKYFPDASGDGLQPSPIDQEIDFNEAEGIINYAYSFNNRYNDNDQSSDNVEDTYSVSRHFTREDGISTYTVAGIVQGLSIGQTGVHPRVAKYANAVNYFNTYVTSNIYSRVTGYYGISLPYPRALVEEIERNPTLGTINYNFQFNNIFPPLASGALSEVISITDENFGYKVNVFSQIGIIGRDGTIRQDMSASPDQIRTINFEVVLGPTGGVTLAQAIALKPDYSSFLAGAKPLNSYTQNDVETWDYYRGRYGKTIRWIF